MKVVADENMPGLDLPPEVDLVRRPGRALARAQLLDADALLVRSVTRVNEALLHDTPVRFVGSATIGTDHVDLDWLFARGIGFAHAPGCNARAVAEYVLAALLDWCAARDREPDGSCIGIVGMGNVGRDVAHLAAALGMEILPCDPPRRQAGECEPWHWVGLDQALAADVVTLHVPLVRDGEHPTFHLLDATRLASLHAGQLLINTCRGAVIDNRALRERLQETSPPDVVLDVWEDEPAVPAALFEQVWRGTPHIAGYSQEGKLRGTATVLSALARREGMTWQPLPVRSPEEAWNAPVVTLEDLRALLRGRYRLERDHKALKNALVGPEPVSAFDRLRRDYPVRHEMAGVKVTGKVAERWQELLSRLGVSTDAA